MYWGLRAQNHRGHQSHGFLTYNAEKFYVYKNLDLVPKLKPSAIQEWFGRLPGHIGIGNVRYTTSGKCDDASLLQGTQPVTASKDGLKLALSFNGNIVNTLQLKKEMNQHFPDFACSCDSDLVCHKLLLELEKGKDLASAVNACMQSLDGAFSVAGITGNGDFFAFKDPHGIKPLCAGHSPDGSNFCFFVRNRQLRHKRFCKRLRTGTRRTCDSFKRRFQTRTTHQEPAKGVLRFRIRLLRET